MAQSYPPRDAAGAQGRDAGASQESTLYSASPHVQLDQKSRDREARRQDRRREFGHGSPLFWGRASRIHNPTLITIAIIALGFVLVLMPKKSAGLWPSGTSSRPTSLTTTTPIPVPEHNSLKTSLMPAQKLFTLSSRTKGCHLVQHEVEAELRDILRGVKVRWLRAWHCCAGAAAVWRAGIAVLTCRRVS